MITGMLEKLLAGKNLTIQEMSEVMDADRKSVV